MFSTCIDNRVSKAIDRFINRLDDDTYLHCERASYRDVIAVLAWDPDSALYDLEKVLPK